MTDGQEDINGRFWKMLYEIKIHDKSAVNPIRTFTRKHVAPTNFEKMNVARAVQCFSKPVIATLQYLKDHPTRHPEAHYFLDAGAFIKFISYVNRWYSMHDVSNRTHYITSKNSDKMHFFQTTDERLQWLEDSFIPYLDEIKKACLENNKPFLNTETREALVLTTKSTVACIKYLLTNGFNYVLTRSFNSDPVEQFFGALRQMSGCDDMLNCRSVISSIDRVLKTGIISTPKTGNVYAGNSVLHAGYMNKKASESTADQSFEPSETESIGTADDRFPGSKEAEMILPKSVLSLLDKLLENPG